MVEVQKHLNENSEYVRAWVSIGQFSFETPKPLQKTYMRKRPARVTSSDGGVDLSSPMPHELTVAAVNHQSWVGPVGYPWLLTPNFEVPFFHLCSTNNPEYYYPGVNLQGTQPSRNSA